MRTAHIRSRGDRAVRAMDAMVISRAALEHSDRQAEANRLYPIAVFFHYSDRPSPGRQDQARSVQPASGALSRQPAELLMPPSQAETDVCGFWGLPPLRRRSNSGTDYPDTNQ